MDAQGELDDTEVGPEMTTGLGDLRDEKSTHLIGKRSKLANHLAFNTQMSVDDAKKTLAASAEDKPETEATPGKGALADAMSGDEGKTAGVDGKDDGEKVSAADRIAAAHAKATGRTKK